MGIYGVANAIGPLSFAATANVTGMIFGISFKDIYVITIIGTILNYIMIPINANITDNLGQLPNKTMNIKAKRKMLSLAKSGSLHQRAIPQMQKLSGVNKVLSISQINAVSSQNYKINRKRGCLTE